MSVADIHEETKCPRCGYTGIYKLVFLKDYSIYNVLISDWNGDLLDGMYCLCPHPFWMPKSISQYRHQYHCFKCNQRLTRHAKDILDYLSKGWPKINLFKEIQPY